LAGKVSNYGLQQCFESVRKKLPTTTAHLLPLGNSIPSAWLQMPVGFKITTFLLLPFSTVSNHLLLLNIDLPPRIYSSCPNGTNAAVGWSFFAFARRVGYVERSNEPEWVTAGPCFYCLTCLLAKLRLSEFWMVLLRSFRITDIDQLRFVATIAIYKVSANDRAFVAVGE
jgi:hypothetical protein